MKPIDKFELNRMVHARAQEIHLPGSPPGVNGHPHLTNIAKEHFGARSWSDLNLEQMRKVYDFLDGHRRLPKRGEI